MVIETIMSHEQDYGDKQAGLFAHIHKGMVDHYKDVPKSMIKMKNRNYKRQKSFAEANLEEAEQNQRKVIKDKYPEDYYGQRRKRLNDLNALCDSTQEKLDREPPQVKVNSECVFYNPMHQDKVQELTKKQVLQGLEKNYAKFRDHYSSIVKRHPKVLKEPQLPVLQKVHQQLNEFEEADSIKPFPELRPHSVEYVRNYPDEGKNIELPAFLTQQERETITGTKLPPGVALRDNFYPPIKVIENDLPNGNSGKKLAAEAGDDIVRVDVKAMKRYHQRKTDSSKYLGIGSGSRV